MPASTPRPTIPVRNVRFRAAQDFDAHWHSANPWISHFYNGLSLMFPDGEKFFMDSVRRYRDRIERPALREQVRGFLGQEAVHAREHQGYNDRLRELGYPVERLLGLVRLLLRLTRALPGRLQLAATCALEHFTATFAHLVLSDPRYFENADPDVRAIWLWHALEESEHKAVAFDVYRTTFPGFRGWLARSLVMAFTMIDFSISVLVFQTILVSRDGRLGDLRAHREAFRYFWGRGGFIRRAIPHLLRYFRPSFHPWDLDDSDLVETTRAKLGPALTEASRSA